MTESCNPIAHFSILFLTFITSHPLYLSYFIFFSPYLLKLFSFLSPLFLTTLLVCFTFLTLLERLLRPDNNDSSGADLEIYDIVFGKVLEEEEESSCTAIPENHVDKVVVVEENQNVQDSVHKVVVEEQKGEEKDKRLENFLQILDQFERMSGTTKKKTKDDLVVEPKDGSDVNAQRSKMRLSSSSRSQSVSFSSVGSMRKEKEWNRTLACKLFEERHHEGGGEGMDSLWETYEETNRSDVNKTNNSRMSKMKNKKKSQVQVDQEEEEEEDAEIVTGQLCCLQALKMSTGKMNLGMKKPNLVKISKAIKGFGWLHSFSKQSSKKVHNNTDSTRYY